MDPDGWQRKKERFDRRMEKFERRWECRSQRMGRMGRPGRHLFSGMIFVAIGVVFLLGNMGMVNVDYVLRFWPVILIAVGLFKLLEYPENYGRGSGIFWIVVGGLFLLGSLGILRVAFRDFWPVVFIGIGALMLWRYAFLGRDPRGGVENWRTGFDRDWSSSGFTEQKTESTAGTGSETGRTAPDPAGPASSDSIISAMAILGSVERRNNSQDFRGGSLTSVMGSCAIDLRDASIVSPHEPVLEVFAMWGSIEVRVPTDWTVVSHVDPIMGGYEDSTRPAKEATKRFIVRGTVLMGGIEIRN
jgi:predicted membrane protein